MAEEKKNRTLMIGGLLLVLLAVLWYLLHRRQGGAAPVAPGVLRPTPLSAQGSSIQLPASSFTYNYPALAPAATPIPPPAPSCTKVCDDCAETNYGPIDTGFGATPEPSLGDLFLSRSVTEPLVQNLSTVNYNSLPGSAGWTQTGVNAYYQAMGIANPTFGF